MKKMRVEVTLMKDHHRENFTLAMYERGLTAEIVCFRGQTIVFDTTAALEAIGRVLERIPGEAGAAVRRS